jgi:2-alkenal reductase
MIKAEVVGSEPDADLAVIKVDLPAAELKPVTLGDSDTIQVGQLSIAIGNPFGQEFTMTSGIVSGVGRTIRSGNSGFSIPEVIQTDAPINPGNSGGPLLNRQGEVIGINAQMLSQTGASSGIGFAVPINIAKQVVPTLVKGESYEYPWLGISGGSLTVEAIEFRKLPAETRGAVVTGVVEDGPAAKAGLLGPDEDLPLESEEFLFGGDVITAINGEVISDMNDLITYLVEETQPGNKVTLDVIRGDGTEEQVEVTLGVRPSSPEQPGQDDD